MRKLIKLKWKMNYNNNDDELIVFWMVEEVIRRSIFKIG